MINNEDCTNDYNYRLERENYGFTQEEIDGFPDMRKDGNKQTGDPDPRWVKIQAASSPKSRQSTPEDGEIIQYESEEDWDSGEGKRRKRVRATNADDI